MLLANSVWGLFGFEPRTDMVRRTRVCAHGDIYGPAAGASDRSES